MLAMGRALMSRPKLLMLDEPSMGLAPLLVEQIFDIIRQLHADGTTILLVEQNAQAALAVADRGYVLETGRIVTEGTGTALLESDTIRKAYIDLGKLYYEGKYVNKNVPRAKKFLNQAAKQGDRDALALLNKIKTERSR
mgnify:CR=1 FL=1